MSQISKVQSGALHRARRGALFATALLATLTSAYASALTLDGAATVPAAPASVAPAVPVSAPAVDAATRSRVVSSYGRLPIRFEPNVGQAPSPVKFLARDAGYSLALTERGAILSLSPGPGKGEAIKPIVSAAKGRSLPVPTEQALLSLSLVHAKSGPGMQAEQRQTSVSNYFIGNDPSKWHSNVANYGAVRYQQVYPGIDWLVYGNPQQLEYDLVVAPQADPRRIRLRIDGADSLALDSNGDLLVKVGDQTLRQLKPVIYQTGIKGDKQSIEGHYVLDRQQLAFDVGDYDHSRSLVIDPALVYSTYLGGTTYDYANGVAVDSSGAAYVTGFASSSNFPTTTGAFQTHLGKTGAAPKAFVAKLDAAGSSLVYSTYLGGTGGDEGTGIAVDSSGAAYVTGLSRSTDFPTTKGAFQTSVTVAGNPFISKLNASGGGLVYSTYLGGDGDNNYGTGIAVDSTGAAYVTGLAGASGFPTTAGAFQANVNGTENAFVTKLSASGSSLVYSTCLGGTGSDYGTGIAVDSSGAAYVTGYAQSSNFPTTGGAFQTSRKGNWNAFVSKLGVDGSSLAYSTYLGGSIHDQGTGVAVDGSGAAYVTGWTVSTDFPTTSGAFQVALTGYENAFVSKLNAGGSGLVYSTYLGGTDIDQTAGIAVNNGAAYVIGFTGSTNFPTTSGAFQTSLAGTFNAFFSRLSTDGSTLSYSTYLGGSASDAGYGIAVDGDGGAYLAGGSESSNFPVTGNAFQASQAGNGNAVISRLIPIILAQLSAAPTALSFGSRSLGSTGASQAVTLSNASDVALPITSIGAGTPAFVQTNSCGSALAASSSCTINVSFSPTVVGAVSDTLTIVTPVTPFTVALSGSGTAAPPTGLTATAGNGEVKLSWTAGFGAASYNVYEGATSEGETAVPVRTGVTNTTTTITGLNNGAPYYFKVSAVDAGAESAKSNQASATPEPVPAAPTGLVATAGNGEVKLSWTASTGATSYSVYEGTTSGGEATVPVRTGVANTAFTVTGLSNGTPYYFKVAAVDVDVDSAKSSQVTATPEVMPAAPTGLTAKAGTGEVKLSWTASAGATSYNLYEGTTSGGEATVPVRTGVVNTAFTITGLTSETPYFFKVTAVDVDVESAKSSQVTATPN